MSIKHLVEVGLFLIMAWSLGWLFIYLVFGALGASIAGIVSVFKKNRGVGILLIIAVVILLTIVIGHLTTPKGTVTSAASTSTTATASSYCNLDHTDFINKLNALRTSNGLSAVSEDTSMDAVATARVKDMLTNNYYGHYNPISKESVATEVQRLTPYEYYAEVLDGALHASQSFDNFKNSPEHYQILTNPDIKYVGIDSEYEPVYVDEYDNDGNKIPNQGGSQYCTVVVDVAY